MQTQRPFPPPFDLRKGYPFNGVNSREFLKDRIDFDVDHDGTILTEISKESVFKLNQALEISEFQLADIFEERPFIPESFGFETLKVDDILKPSIYNNRFNDKIFLYRLPGSHLWVLRIYPEVENAFQEKPTEIHLDLPCARIVFAVFYAMNIQMQDEEIELLEAPEPPVFMSPQ